MRLRHIFTTTLLAISSVTGANAQSWAGFYAGAYAASNDFSMEISPTVYGNTSISGGIFGGYNYQVSPNYILGGEVYYDATAGNTFPFLSAELNGQYGIRGRAGYVMGNSLIYGAVGVDFGMFDVTGSPPGASETVTGYSGALGLEHMLSNQLSVRAEYSYTQYEEYFVFPGFTPTVKSIRLGMAYHF